MPIYNMDIWHAITEAIGNYLPASDVPVHLHWEQFNPRGVYHSHTVLNCMVQHPACSLSDVKNIIPSTHHHIIVKFIDPNYNSGSWQDVHPNLRDEIVRAWPEAKNILKAWKEEGLYSSGSEN